MNRRYFGGLLLAAGSGTLVRAGDAPPGQGPPSPAPGQGATPTLGLDWPVLGRLRPRAAHQIASSPWSVGGEALDRDFAVYDHYKAYLGPLGAKGLRLQAGWAKCETVRGEYSWAWLDAIIDDAIGQGVRPWLQLSYGNPSYPGGGGTGLGGGLPASPEALAAWDRWALALVDRYKGRVRDWEVWNEPDLNETERTSPEAYADLFVRTAAIIRKAHPEGRILALALAHDLKYAGRFLDVLGTRGRLDLVDAITIHTYPNNPDETSNVDRLRALIRETGRRIEVRQGETGAPSRFQEDYALKGIDWTETMQAKWDLRRMLAHHAKGVPVNLFTMADLHYRLDDGGVQMNYKGLLATNPDRTIAHVKPSYHAAQGLFALFDDTLEPIADYPAKTTSLRRVALHGYRRGPGGPQLVAFWFDDAPPCDARGITSIGLTLAAARFDDPVLIDVRTCNVHAIPRTDGPRRTPGYGFRKIPCYDSPMLIAERADVAVATPAIVHELAGWSRADKKTRRQEVLRPSAGDAGGLTAVRCRCTGWRASSIAVKLPIRAPMAPPTLHRSSSAPVGRCEGHPRDGWPRHSSTTTPDEPPQLPPCLAPRRAAEPAPRRGLAPAAYPPVQRLADGEHRRRRARAGHPRPAGEASPEAEITLWPHYHHHPPEEVAMLTRRFPKLRIVAGQLGEAGEPPAEVGAAMDAADFFLHGSGPATIGWRQIAAFRKRTGRGFGVYGVTYGLYGTPEKALLSDAAFLYFRDSVSLERARRDGIRAPVMEFGPDAVFALDVRDDARAAAYLRGVGLEDGRFLVCLPKQRITPSWLHKQKARPFDEAKHARNEAMKEHDHAPLREAITSITRETGMKVLIGHEDETELPIGKAWVLAGSPPTCGRSACGGTRLGPGGGGGHLRALRGDGLARDAQPDHVHRAGGASDRLPLGGAEQQGRHVARHRPGGLALRLRPGGGGGAHARRGARPRARPSGGKGQGSRGPPVRQSMLQQVHGRVEWQAGMSSTGAIFVGPPRR
jgi:hypothetical protein